MCHILPFSVTNYLVSYHLSFYIQKNKYGKLKKQNKKASKHGLKS